VTEDQLQNAEHLLDDLENLERQLHQLQEGLTRSHRLATLGTVATIIAHEFNNILTPVISYAQIALNDNNGEPDVELMRKALQRAYDGATKAAQISTSMLGFARASTEDSPKAAVVREVVADVFACLARDPQKDNINLRLDVPDDLAVAMPPISLQQVLLNLVLNARKVLRQRGGMLRISAEPVADDPHANDETEHIRIEVADTGPGIDPAILPRIFEPFVTQQAGHNDKPATEGTGLGLAVCKDLVERAGGAIDVESAPGEGATFHIELPAARQ